jgi:uncharacterized protein (DUF2147 family)
MNMMRALGAALAIGILFSPPVSAGGGDAILGLWLTEPDEVEGQAHVEIYADGDRYNGRIVWLEKPLYEGGEDDGEAGDPKRDANNPDPDLRSRPIMGLELMEGFEYVGDGGWAHGTIYDPAKGKTYKCKLRLVDDETLKVRGFIGISLLGRNSIWTRVHSEE